MENSTKPSRNETHPSKPDSSLDILTNALLVSSLQKDLKTIFDEIFSSTSSSQPGLYVKRNIKHQFTVAESYLLAQESINRFEFKLTSFVIEDKNLSIHNRITQPNGQILSLFESFLDKLNEQYSAVGNLNTSEDVMALIKLSFNENHQLSKEIMARVENHNLSSLCAYSNKTNVSSSSYLQFSLITKVDEIPVDEESLSESEEYSEPGNELGDRNERRFKFSRS